MTRFLCREPLSLWWQPSGWHPLHLDWVAGATFTLPCVLSSFSWPCNVTHSTDVNSAYQADSCTGCWKRHFVLQQNMICNKNCFRLIWIAKWTLLLVIASACSRLYGQTLPLLKDTDVGANIGCEASSTGVVVLTTYEISASLEDLELALEFVKTLYIGSIWKPHRTRGLLRSTAQTLL